MISFSIITEEKEFTQYDVKKGKGKAIGGLVSAALIGSPEVGGFIGGKLSEDPNLKKTPIDFDKSGDRFFTHINKTWNTKNVLKRVGGGVAGALGGAALGALSGDDSNVNKGALIGGLS